MASRPCRPSLTHTVSLIELSLLRIDRRLPKGNDTDAHRRRRPPPRYITFY